MEAIAEAKRLQRAELQRAEVHAQQAREPTPAQAPTQGRHEPESGSERRGALGGGGGAPPSERPAPLPPVAAAPGAAGVAPATLPDIVPDMAALKAMERAGLPPPPLPPVPPPLPSPPLPSPPLPPPSRADLSAEALPRSLSLPSEGAVDATPASASASASATASAPASSRAFSAAAAAAAAAATAVPAPSLKPLQPVVDLVAANTAPSPNTAPPPVSPVSPAATAWAGEASGGMRGGVGWREAGGGLGEGMTMSAALGHGMVEAMTAWGRAGGEAVMGEAGMGEAGVGGTPRGRGELESGDLRHKPKDRRVRWGPIAPAAAPTTTATVPPPPRPTPATAATAATSAPDPGAIVPPPRSQLLLLASTSDLRQAARNALGPGCLADMVRWHTRLAPAARACIPPCTRALTCAEA